MKSPRVLLTSHDPVRRKRLVDLIATRPNLLLKGEGPGFLDVLALAPKGSPRPDVLIIDLSDPPMSTPRPWAILRVALPDVGIIALTSGDETSAIELALAGGVSVFETTNPSADQFFMALEAALAGGRHCAGPLLSKVGMVLANPPSTRTSAITIGRLVIDRTKPQVRVGPRLVRLSALEHRVLLYLSMRNERPIDQDELLRVVWGTSKEAGGTTAQVKNCIRRLRVKLEADPGSPRHLITVRGSGYALRG